MSKVTLSGYILVPEHELIPVKNALTQHIALTQAEAGCLVFNVIQSVENPLRFNVYEEFSDKEAFARHQQRVATSDWGKVTVNVQRHYHIHESDNG